MRRRELDADGFQPGTVVLLTLHSPREKVAGVLLRLAPVGVELRCVALESLDDLARQIRAGEPAIAATVFFPMHRVERMELDETTGELPSLAQSFAANAGRSLQEVFAGGPATGKNVFGKQASGKQSSGKQSSGKQASGKHVSGKQGKGRSR